MLSMYRIWNFSYEPESQCGEQFLLAFGRTLLTRVSLLKICSNVFVIGVAFLKKISMLAPL